MPLSLGPERDAFPCASRHTPVRAPRGVVATSEPLAAQAGHEMLRTGGNAVDAALATAIALAVLEPTSNGIGSDAFALVWDSAKLHGLNGSGRAPKTHTLDLFTAGSHATAPNGVSFLRVKRELTGAAR
ncbi:MAG: gamma-glutamyltransferase [Chloroflexota bacterium]